MNVSCIVLWLSVNGIVCGRPTLEPPYLYICPNETAVFTCHDKQIQTMMWIAEPYIAEDYPLTCATNYIEEDTKLPIECYKPDEVDNGYYSASIINVTNMSGNLADMTAILTIYNITLIRSIPKSLKSIMVICKTNFITSAYLTLAGLDYVLFVITIDIPRWKNDSITFQEKETYFTAVLELGDMFDGGGVPIDHYIIQVGNNTQLETPGPTYSVDVMYNEILTVNISAHNCAGYSDVMMLTLEYDRGLYKNCTTDSLDPSTLPTSESSPSPELPIFVSISIGIVVIILTILVVLSLLLYKLHQRCAKSRANSKSQEVCGVTDNPAYETCTSVERLEPGYNMDNNPVYMINNNTTLQKTEIAIYETIQ